MQLEDLLKELLAKIDLLNKRFNDLTEQVESVADELYELNAKK